MAAYQNPLNEAKRAVEHRLQASGMNYVSPQANYFMEIWLSPALGFDFANHAARVFGDGNQATSFVSYVDVAKAAVASLDHPTVRNRMIPVGGPAAPTQRECIGVFERAAGADFAVDQVPQAALEQQKAGVDNPLDQSFGGLMLVLAKGLPMDMEPVTREWNLQHSSVEDYARRVLGR